MYKQTNIYLLFLLFNLSSKQLIRSHLDFQPVHFNMADWVLVIKTKLLSTTKYKKIVICKIKSGRGLVNVATEHVKRIWVQIEQRPLVILE